MTNATEADSGLLGEGEGQPGGANAAQAEGAPSSDTGLLGGANGASAEPATTESVDLRWIPKEMREVVSGLPAEAQSAVIDLHRMMTNNYQRDKTAVSLERKQLEELKPFLELGKRVADDPDLLAAVARGGHPAAANGMARQEEEVDLLQMDGTQLKAYIERLVDQRSTAKAQELIQQTPLVVQHRAQQEFRRHLADRELDARDPAVSEAVQMVEKQYLAHGIDVYRDDPSRVAAMFDMAYELASARSRTIQPRTTPAPRAASATGRAAGTSTAPVRPWEQGDQPRKPTKAEAFKYGGTKSDAEMDAMWAAMKREHGAS